MGKWMMAMGVVMSGCLAGVLLGNTPRAHAEQTVTPLAQRAADKRRPESMIARLPAGPSVIYSADREVLRLLMAHQLGGGSPKNVVQAISSCALETLGPDTFVAGSTEPRAVRQGLPRRTVLRTFVAGLEMSKLVHCVESTSVESQLSSDGRYLSVALVPGRISVSFLAVAGGLYSGMTIADGGKTAEPFSRADLEAEARDLPRTSAANDSRFSDEIAKLDAASNLWVLAASDRPLAQRSYDSLRVDASFQGGLSLRLAFELASAERARSSHQLFAAWVARFPQAGTPSALVESLRALKVQRAGREVRMSLRRDPAQLKALAGGLGLGDLFDLVDKLAPVPDRFTPAQVASMITAMQQCNGDSSTARLSCACDSDLALSTVAKPKDLATPCAAYVKGMQKLNTTTPQRTAHQLVAPDVGPGTLIVANYARDCKKAAPRSDAWCTCLTNHFANRMARHDTTTVGKLSDAGKKVGTELATERPCGKK